MTLDLTLCKTMAAVTSGLLTIVKTGITIVSYFGNVTASVAAARKICRDWLKQTIVFIVDSFNCFISIVSRSIVSIQ